MRVKTTHFRVSCPFNNTWHFTGGYQRQIVAIFFLSVSLEAEVKDNYISYDVAHSSRKNLGYMAYEPVCSERITQWSLWTSTRLLTCTFVELKLL